MHDVTLGRDWGTKIHFPWFGLALMTKVLNQGGVVVRRKREKPLSVVHVDRLEVYKEKVVPAWMVAEQRGCIAVQGVGSAGVSRHL